MNLIDLFRTDITKIEETQINTRSSMKTIFTEQLWKTYITAEDIRKKQEDIFNYKFEI